MTIKELREKRAAAKQKMLSIVDKAEAENRSVTAEEAKEIEEIEAEIRSYNAALTAKNHQPIAQLTDALTEAAQAVRSVAKREADGVSINFRAIANATTAATTAGAASESTLGVVEPLEKGLILETIGAQIRTDIPGGGKWAVVAPAQATFENEATELSTSAVNVTKKATTPHRLGIKVFVSHEAMLMSDIDLMNRVIMPEVQKAIRRELNAWMFATTAYNSAHGAAGVFVNAATKVTAKGAVPTAAELAQLRGKVKAKGAYDDGTYRYVMSSIMAAELSTTPVAEGSSKMILEDGKIGGVPVFETEYIEHGNSNVDTKGAKYVGFGRFSDAVVAQFGAAELNIDSNSVTAASAGGTYVVLNVWYDLVSLYDGKSFGLLTSTIA